MKAFRFKEKVIVLNHICFATDFQHCHNRDLTCLYVLHMQHAVYPDGL